MFKQVDLCHFTQKYQEAFKQPIIQKFLKDSNNYKVFLDYLQHPESKHHIEELDKSFKIFYKKSKLGKYLDNLIHFYSIDYDKRRRKIHSRFLLTLNGSGEDDSDGKFIEKSDKYIMAEEKSILELMISSSSGLKSHIEDESLYKAFLKLTPKQQHILELIYVKGLSNIEVSEYYNDSPQNISAIHKRALKKLKIEYLQD
ncbi:MULTISPECIES: sigma-70 family RNA polymerase sigma factor [Bacillus]|uniref:sigma-70 family RNA polymerase sigma factor n=1 Tax=Bacillus TaxID=1386 RepID=UPI00077AF110|nr:MULTISPECIES: sigma-70 family RNA polymerase sigma factor [Bacillus]KAB2372789.1 sigma-70 family RNA polymerase sigma factor [Bacillus sp. RM2(2019)]KXY52289.1 hypothetical protein AT261_05385 [Bacillus cereus]PGW51475.1 sigma-70 family RNA polymerase sigma factor [Bacillus thuringiensis]